MTKQNIIRDESALEERAEQMETDFYNIIDKFRLPKEKNTQFAKRLGIHPSMLRYWEKGMIPKPATVRKVAKALRLDNNTRKQLLVFSAPHGKYEGDGGVRSRLTPPVPADFELERAPVAERQFIPIPKIDPILQNGEIQTSESDVWLMLRIDFLDSIATRFKNIFAFHVREKSMIPTLLSGDTVLVDIGRINPTDNHLYLVELDGVARIRRLSLLPDGKARLVPDAEPQEFLEGKPGHELHILGQIIWFCRTAI